MSWKTKVALGATVGTVAGVGLAVAAPTIILPAIGFGAAGVAKASVAAGIQSVIVTVGKGSLFAAAQSAGAVGSISSVTGGIVTGIGTAGGVAFGATGSAVSWLRGKVSSPIICIKFANYFDMYKRFKYCSSYTICLLIYRNQNLMSRKHPATMPENQLIGIKELSD
jgi:hypothetical protein